MRLLARGVVSLFAVVGIKALYDRLAPKVKGLREPANEVLDSAKSSSREFASHAKAAGSEVLADARDRSADLREVATDAIETTPSNGGSTSAKKKSKH
jgi:ElaB/YqjD/DUF883 family membrane-anchored ribosome-binding protein